MATTYTGTSADNSISLANFGQPGGQNTYTIDGAGGTDTFYFANGTTSYLSRFSSSKFTIAPVNSSGVIVVTGASNGGSQFTLYLTSVEKLVFGDTTVNLSYGPVADTTAPVFSSATVNGSTLVLTYTDLSNLDAANPPAASAFTVSGGHTVSGVLVNAASKTVTLTLSTPAAYGEAVTVSYTDPTAGNDVSAIQDASGNDAASLSATAVTNNTPDTTAPVFSSATVNGSTLMLTYTDANNLDASNPPAASAFTVSGGHTVSGVSVNAAAKTVTLTLSTPVGYGEAVTVSYTDPTVGNDAKAIQDLAGNDAASLSARAVTNNTPDTTAPVFSSATVNGTTLVLTYTDANNLDASNPPAASAFTVSGGHTVSGVSVNAASKTVTLTLSTPAAYGEAVTVSYTDPSAGNDAKAIQDLAGNDAASLSARAVTNNTPDTTAPVFSSATVIGSTLVLTYTDLSNLDAANPPAASAFTVSGGHTVSGVSVNAAAKTVTLTLSTPAAYGEAVTVSYTDPTAGNDVSAIQDASGNDAASLSATAVTNNTPDTTAPVFSSATVNGSTLVLTYTDANNLDASNPPAASAFTVSGGHTVSGVSVNAAAKTVTLTLSTPAAYGEAVTVSYTDPTAGNDTKAIQDLAGNDAASLSAAVVANNTPDTTAPVLSSAVVNGTTLVLTYTDLNNLDSANPPAASAFTVSGGHTVSGVSVNAASKTVTLTLSTPAAYGEAVTVSYTDPSAGNDAKAIQDLAGNDAASLSARAVTNNTPDTIAPVFSSATVNGSTLVLTYTDPNNLDAANPPVADAFTVSGGHTVSGVSVNAAAKTVTLTLSTPVTNGEAVTVSYSDPSAGNDVSAIQDASGNDAASLSSAAVSNITPVPGDTTAPVFSSATVNGTTLVLTYTDANNLDATNPPAAGAFTVSGGHTVSGVSVNAAAKTVTLTLSTPAAYGEAVTVSYTDPTAGNDVSAIQDASGNDAASLSATAVTNNTPVPADTTAPVFSSATVNGSTLVLTYTDANNLDSANPPAASAFTVSGGHTVSGVSVNAAAKTVTLTLSTPAAYGEAVTVSYTDPTAGNDGKAIQDLAGNDAASLSARAVTNNTPVPADTTAPVFSSATVNGSTLVLTYTDANNLDSANPPAASAFTVSGGHTVSGVLVNAASKTVTLTLLTPAAYGEAVTVSYTDPTVGNDVSAIQDASGNDAASLSARAVTNNTPLPADTTAPVFSSAMVNGSTLVLTYTDLNNLDSANPPAASAFTVSGGHTVSGVLVNAASKTVTLTLSSPAAYAETVTVSYTDPTAGNDAKAIQDLTGNDAASLSAKAVTNNTPDTTAPVFSSATVNGSMLVLNYTDLNNLDSANPPAASAFTVSGGHTVSGVSVNAASKTVTLTLSTPAAYGETVTVSYTDPSAGNDLKAIQDLAGNDAASLSARAVTNNTPVPADTTAPVFSSATVNGSTLVLTYTDLNNLDAANPPAASAFTVSGHTVSGVSVNSAAKTVTLTLSTPAAYGETVTVSYTDPTAGNDGKAIQDLAGNDAASFSARPATNSTPVSGDTAAPVFSSAVVNGSTLVLTYTDANNLDAANPPSASAFRVSGHVVSGVSVNAAAKTVTLTLSTPAVFGETVTVSYTDPSAGNDAKAIQDLAGNDAAGFWAKPATNNTPSPVQGGSSDGEDDSEDDSHDFSGSSESDDDSDNHNNSSKVKSGTSGNDNLSGSGGEYIMIGGKGNDTYIVDSSGDVVTEQKNEGTDTVKSSISFILGSNVENLTLTGSNSINGTGNSLNNIIIGNTGNNIIDGGAGNDTMQGGQGNDTYIVNATGDVVNESAYQGSDTVKTSVSYTLGANVENLSLTGSASINGTGNALANSLIGNIGNNILVGGAGNDLIAGDYGNDTLTGGSGRDSFIFNTIPGFGNRDTITDFVHGTDKLQFSSSVFTGFDGLIGTPGSDQFYSAAGAVTAHDLSDRIIYNSSTGALYYDLDGAGGTDAIQVAVLGTGSHPSLSASDIQIIT